MKMGPLTMRSVSDYTVFEPPRRSINRILESPFGGLFYVDFVPVAQGTRVTERWEVNPPNRGIAFLMPMLRPILQRSLQKDLDGWARVAGSQ